MIVNAVQGSYFREVVEDEARKKARLTPAPKTIVDLQKELEDKYGNMAKGESDPSENDSLNFLRESQAVQQLMKLEENLANTENQLGSNRHKDNLERKSRTPMAKSRRPRPGTCSRSKTIPRYRDC